MYNRELNCVMCQIYGSYAKQQFNIRSSKRKNFLSTVLIMYDGHEKNLMMDVFSIDEELSNRQHLF